MIINNLLPQPKVAEFMLMANTGTTDWIDGGKTSSVTGKKNSFVNRNSAAGKHITETVMESLHRSTDFAESAFPAKITPPFLVRYVTGDRYDPHIDNAMMGDVRTDLACTIFLNDGFVGGDLMVGDHTVTLSPGRGYLYPAHTIHQVTPITEGARLVILFWVQSKVRSVEKRDLLAQMIGALRKMNGEGPALEMSACYNNLYRMWSE